MKDAISQFILENSGLAHGFIVTLCVLVAVYVIYLDRDEYRHWRDNSPANKFFLLAKVFALAVLTIAALRVLG